MTSPPRRRPLPALVFLVALTLLTALVWWRVLSRTDSHATGQACPTSSATTHSNVLPRPGQVHLTVLNSTKTFHLATNTAKALGKLGFKIDKVGNDEGHAAIAGVAEIRYLSDARPDAVLLSYYLPGATLQLVTSKSATTPALVVSLGKSFKKLATTAAVTAKLREGHQSLAPTTAPSSSAPNSGASASC